MTTTKRYQEYLDFVKKYSKHLGYKGDYKKGEIEIVTDVSLFPKCEEGAVKLMTETGVSVEAAKKRAVVGVRDENRWGVVVCEPLRLPNGDYTTFVRPISWGELDSGIAGVVIVPVLPDDRFILLKTFRHNVRTWCLEFPRGGKDPKASLLRTIKAELSEEIGAKILDEPQKIGEVFPDSGFLASRVEVYRARVELSTIPDHLATEAIQGVLFLTKGELKALVKAGEYKDKTGRMYKISDSYTLSALTLMNS